VDGKFAVLADSSSVVTCDDKQSAVTALFSVYWIFDLKYSTKHKRTMELFAKVIFKVEKGKIGSAVQTVLNALQSLLLIFLCHIFNFVMY